MASYAGLSTIFGINRSTNYYCSWPWTGRRYPNGKLSDYCAAQLLEQ